MSSIWARAQTPTAWKHCINLLLNIGDGIDVSYNGDRKCFLTSIRHYRKHETMVGMQLQLIKKTGSVKNWQIGTSWHVCYKFWLQGKEVWVGHQYIIQFSDIYHFSSFLFAFQCRFEYFKNRKAEKGIRFGKNKSPLCLQYIKDIANQLSRFRTQRIYPSLDISNSELPVVL